MKKIVLVLIIVVLAAMLAACNSTEDTISAGNAETANVDVDMDNDEPVEVQDTETKEVFADIVRSEEFCVPGSIYTHASENGNIDSKVIGLTMHKESEFCQARLVSIIPTQLGDMNSDVTYYFDKTYKEFWVTTTLKGGPTPEEVTTEVHIIDGVMQ